MLRMDGFDYLPARSPEHAVALFQAHPNSSYVAGGTDLLPNLKHRIVKPRHLIGIGAILPSGWEVDGDRLVVGAGTRLSTLARLAEIPPLARAASLVASPQIRNMGTLGGNILLDTRCVYYNQSEFWRNALGHCLKAEGTWCHVIGSARTCVATQSSDTVPVLLAIGATLRLLGPAGPRELPIADLFHHDGKNHLKIEPGELLTHVVVPLPGPSFRGTYEKVRIRDSIDFPMLGVAVTGDFAGDVATALRVVVGAINPAPRVVPGIAAFEGRPLDDAALNELADLVKKRCKPQGSVQGPVPAMERWRREMAGTLTRRALRGLLGR